MPASFFKRRVAARVWILWSLARIRRWRKRTDFSSEPEYLLPSESVAIPTDLQNSPAEIVAQYLVNIGVGSDATAPLAAKFNNRHKLIGSGPPNSVQWPVYYANEPSSPDSVITVFDTMGQINSRYMGSGIYYVYWGLQIRVRSYDHQSGWLKAESIRRILSTITTQNIVSGSYLQSNVYCMLPFTGIGMVLPIGNDTPQTKRKIFTLNLMAIISQISS